MQLEEFSCLRDELIQRNGFIFENSSKTINHIFLMWSGTLVLLGTTKTISDIGEHHVIIAVGILFISNIILYLAAQKNLKYVDSISKLSSYITVFYERKDIKYKNVKCDEDDKYGFWEIATFETKMKRSNDVEEKLRSWNIIIMEFFIVALISTFLISICVVYFLFVKLQSSHEFTIRIFTILNLIVLCVSTFMTYKIFKENPPKYGLESRIKWLHIFFDYALENEYYTDEEVKIRFGQDFLKAINYRISKHSD